MRTVYSAKILLRLPLSNSAQLDHFIEHCLADKVVLIAIEGDGCAAVEDRIDDLIVGDGSDETRFIVTTSHPGESFADVLEFAEMWSSEGNPAVQIVRL